MPAMPVDGAGYWILPTDQVILVTTHVSLVCSHPQLLGRTETEVRTLFQAFEEPWGSEMKAREHILRRMISGGWVRTRNYYERGWTCNVPDFSATSLGRACGFFRLTSGTKNLDFSPVRLDGPDTVRHAEVADLQTGRVFPGGRIPEGGIPKLIFVDDPGQISLNGLPQIDLRIDPDLSDEKARLAAELRAEVVRIADGVDRYLAEHPELLPPPAKRRGKP